MTRNEATRILVIEDNPTNRELMVYLLKAFGYATVEADDGVAGLEMARAQRPDLIVCDVQLPKLDGYGVVRSLKSEESLRDVPVVAVTALAMVGDRDHILRAGFDGYVSKPITPETFVPDLEKFLPLELRCQVRRPIHATVPSGVADADRVTNGARGTVLAVDDIPANLEFVCSTLRPIGYGVLTADGVESAIAITRESRPDLLLCDLHMEPQSGLDLLDRAKTEPALRAIPVIIISSTATGSYDEIECLRRGAANFLKRPIEPEMLLAEIAQAIANAKTK